MNFSINPPEPGRNSLGKSQWANSQLSSSCAFSWTTWHGTSITRSRSRPSRPFVCHGDQILPIRLLAWLSGRVPPIVSQAAKFQKSKQIIRRQLLFCLNFRPWTMIYDSSPCLSINQNAHSMLCLSSPFLLPTLHLGSVPNCGDSFVAPMLRQQPPPTTALSTQANKSRRRRSRAVICVLRASNYCN